MTQIYLVTVIYIIQLYLNFGSDVKEVRFEFSFSHKNHGIVYNTSEEKYNKTHEICNQYGRHVTEKRGNFWQDL